MLRLLLKMVRPGISHSSTKSQMRGWDCSGTMGFSVTIWKNCVHGIFSTEVTYRFALLHYHYVSIIACIIDVWCFAGWRCRVDWRSNFSMVHSNQTAASAPKPHRKTEWLACACSPMWISLRIPDGESAPPPHESGIWRTHNLQNVLTDTTVWLTLTSKCTPCETPS